MKETVKKHKYMIISLITSISSGVAVFLIMELRFYVSNVIVEIISSIITFLVIIGFFAFPKMKLNAKDKKKDFNTPIRMGVKDLKSLAQKCECGLLLSIHMKKCPDCGRENKHYKPTE